MLGLQSGAGVGAGSLALTAANLLQPVAAAGQGGGSASVLALPSSGLIAAYIADDLAGADASNVTTWDDRSANNLDLNIARNNGGVLKHSIINGRKVVRFDGTRGLRTTSDLPMGSLSKCRVYAVMKNNTADNTVPYECAPLPISSLAVSFYHHVGDADNDQIGHGGNSGNSVWLPDSDATNFYLWTHTHDKTLATSEVSVRRNRAAASGSQGNNPNNTDTLDNGPLCVGGRNVQTTGVDAPWTGDIACLLVYDSTETMADVEAWLAAYYGF